MLSINLWLVAVVSWGYFTFTVNEYKSAWSYCDKLLHAFITLFLLLFTIHSFHFLVSFPFNIETSLNQLKLNIPVFSERMVVIVSFVFELINAIAFFYIFLLLLGKKSGLFLVYLLIPIFCYWCWTLLPVIMENFHNNFDNSFYYFFLGINTVLCVGIAVFYNRRKIKDSFVC